MIPYCDSLSNLSAPWVNDGFSQCFFTTVTTSVIAGIAFIFGGIQIYFYRKYATSAEDNRWESKLLKYLYFLQLALVVLVSLESFARLALNGLLIDNKQIYG